MTKAKVVWNRGDAARVIADLSHAGPLSERCVLVPNARVAHALRRELLAASRIDSLAGTRFVPVYAAALAVLERAGSSCVAGEDSLRAMRLVSVFARGLSLSYFEIDDLRRVRGWEMAFARTIADLEAGGLRPSSLDGDDPRFRDVATIWAAVEEAAGGSWARGRVLVEAASALSADPALWPFGGLVLAVVDGGASVAEAGFITTVPGVQLVISAGRPLRRDYVERVSTSFGAAAAEVLGSVGAPIRKNSERDLLASYLFEPAEVLATADRPRSSGADGTVELEEHAGVEAEIEAAVDWVVREVLEKRVPLEDVAILLPALDPVAEMLVARLGRAPWAEGKLPVHVAGGLPASGLAAGARIFALLRGLGHFLSADSLAQVLPALRTTGDARHLARGAALALAYALGTAGGSRANPAGALEWAERARKRESDLSALLEKARAAGDDAEKAGLAREAWQVERLLADLRAVRPVLEALVGVARLFVEGAPLNVLWPALKEFLAAWLLAPGSGAPIHELLGGALQAFCADPVCGSIAGEDALRVIEGALLGLRIPVGRFGEPAVYVGTIASARGIPFTAVRVMGLREGSLPSMAAEDAVLPDSLRAVLGAVVPRAGERALDELHALDQVVRNTRERIVLSFPRLDLQRSQHEPSSVFIEVAAAIGRPNRTTGEPAKPIPGVTDLVRDYFQPARERAQALRLGAPIGEAAWEDRVALGNGRVPSSWSGSPALDLLRVRGLVSAPGAGAFDGVLDSVPTDLLLPGLRKEQPISASQLTTLLGCPHRFLFERVLGWREPAGPPATKEIDALGYGSLLHKVAERFYREHGKPFGKREGSLAKWQSVAAAAVEAAFVEFLEEYPLPGKEVRAQQLERLRGDFAAFLESDWLGGKPREHVGVEIAFGHEGEALEIDLPSGPLFVRGFIDRVDVEDGRVLVRDLKSGRSHPRIGNEIDPDHGRDVQIALYGLVAPRLAVKHGLPKGVAAAYAYMDLNDPERAFREDFAVLESAAREWLDVSVNLLRAGLFPRTPREDDCKWCSFRPVCGENVYERASQVIAEGGAAFEAFAVLKGIGLGDDEEED